MVRETGTFITSFPYFTKIVTYIGKNYNNLVNCIYIFAYFKKYLYLQCNYNINEKKVIVLSIENEHFYWLKFEKKVVFMMKS